jgi:hypothetical protein
MERTRVFWVYFIITLFFIIIGLGSLLTGSVPVWITFLWLLTAIFLMITIFNAYINLEQTTWLNILFVVMLIISYIWTYEVKNQENNLDSVAGISLLLGGLILSMWVKIYSIPFWSIIVYIVIWFVIIVNSLVFSH